MKRVIPKSRLKIQSTRLHNRCQYNILAAHIMCKCEYSSNSLHYTSNHLLDNMRKNTNIFLFKQKVYNEKYKRSNTIEKHITHPKGYQEHLKIPNKKCIMQIFKLPWHKDADHMQHLHYKSSSLTSPHSYISQRLCNPLFDNNFLGRQLSINRMKRNIGYGSSGSH